jgi:phosphotriesterase-related protein
MGIITVQGVIDKEEAGIILPHEHILIDLRNQFVEPDEVSRKFLAEQKVGLENIDILKRNPWALRDNLVINDPECAEEEVMRYKKAGGGTIVDVTNVGLGRDPTVLYEISRAVGVHIVTGCGYYYQATHPPAVADLSADDIAKEMIIDITSGIDGTKIRAGVIGELGISEEMHPDEEKVLIAAARAQAETGIPIQVHIFPWRERGIPLGLDALDILAKNGADLSKVVVDHVDVAFTINIEYAVEIAKRGAYIEFDNFGHEFYLDRRDRKFIPGPFASDVQRIEALQKLVAKGYVNQILLSCDICHKTLLHRYGGWGYDHILTHIVPMLDELGGLSPDQIRTLIEDNPRRFYDVANL